MRSEYNPKTARFYLLNNDGTRGVSIDANGNRERLPVTLDGVTIKARAVLYHQQLGNFSTPFIRVKGKAVAVFPDSENKVWMPFEIKYPNHEKS